MSIQKLAQASAPLRPTLIERDLPDTIGGNFGRWLRAIRLKHGLTLRAIAEASGGMLTEPSLRNLEVRGNAPKLDMFLGLCHTLDIDPCEALKQVFTGSLDQQVAAEYTGI